MPPSKSMPRLSPLTAMAPIESTITTPEIANQRFRRPMKSRRIHFGGSPSAPIRRGLSNQLKPARSPRIARVAATAVSSEISVPISSISAKPFTPAVATRKRMTAVIAVTTFASMIVAKPLP